MKTRRARRPLRSISEINMTPLLDLTFLLLITFVITFPLIEQGIQIRLPVARAQALEAQTVLTVTADAAGQLYLDHQPLDLDALEQALRERAAAEADLMVRVRGDVRLAYGDIVEVLKRIRRANITRMALVTEGDA